MLDVLMWLLLVVVASFVLTVLGILLQVAVLGHWSSVVGRGRLRRVGSATPPQASYRSTGHCTSSHKTHSE